MISLRSCLISTAVLAASVFPTSASADIIEVYRTVGVAGGTSYDVPTIVVKGKSRGRYSEATTRELLVWLTIAGSAPNRDKRHNGSYVNIAGTSVDIEKPGAPKIKRFGFVYTKPDSTGGTYKLSPVELCNSEASKGGRQARGRFIRKGGMIRLENAYLVKATANWIVRKRGSTFNEPASWNSETRIPVVVKCLPTGHFAKTSTTTSTTSANGSDAMREELERKRRERERENRNQPRRTNPAPTIKGMSLTSAPAEVKRVGNWMCPTVMRLKGRIDVNRAFKGNAIFLGGQWLSNNNALDFRRAGGRYLIANRPLNWRVSGLSTGRNTAPRKQIDLSFNVTNQAGKLIQSKKKRVLVTCVKPRPGVRTNATGEGTN